MTSNIASSAAPRITRELPEAPATIDFFTIHLRNFEALVKVQQTMIEISKTLFADYNRILTSTLDQTLKNTRDIFFERDFKASVKKRFQSVRESIEDAVYNTNSIVETSARGSGKAANIVKERTTKAIDETQSVVERILNV